MTVYIEMENNISITFSADILGNCKVVPAGRDRDQKIFTGTGTEKK
jgi:hypothetical protein